MSTGADRAAITCFVAMPVGRPDVNTLYDRQINRVLRQLHIRPVFMGRLEHNDNIDTRIIEEIKKCDFAIADLTYARPSVYYEAGFAERSVYVIYTCRADHFKPKADDKEGNLQVHFDLRQKNIVSWSSSGDASFARRLEKRIELVIRPLLRVKQASAEREREIHEFRRLAMESRLTVVYWAFRKALKRHGFRPIVQSDEVRPWVASLVASGTVNLAVLCVQERFTTKQIREGVHQVVGLLWSRSRNIEDPYSQEFRYLKKPSQRELQNVKNLKAQIVFCSLDRTAPQRVAAAVPRFTPNRELNVYEGSPINVYESSPIPLSPRSSLLPLSVSVYIIDGVQSERIALEKARALTLVPRRSQ